MSGSKFLDYGFSVVAGCYISTYTFICFVVFIPLLMDEHVDSCTAVFGWRRPDRPHRESARDGSSPSCAAKKGENNMDRNKDDKE